MEPPKFARPEPAQDTAVARFLAGVLPGASDEGAAAFVAAARTDPSLDLFAAFAGDEPLALYLLRKVGMTTELVLVAASPEVDPAVGLEAAAVRDAGARVGRRPLTVETTEQAAEWYKGLGFKLVGRRKRPDGGWTYRLGWHAPRPVAEAPARP